MELLLPSPILPLRCRLSLEDDSGYALFRGIIMGHALVDGTDPSNRFTASGGTLFRVGLDGSQTSGRLARSHLASFNTCAIKP